MGKKKEPKRSNPVAKYGRKFNKAAVHVDKKKEQKKRGHECTRCVWNLESEA